MLPVLLAVRCLTALVAAGAAAARPVEEARVVLVELEVAVRRDGGDEPVRGLSRARFTVQERGAPRSLARFQEVAGAPVVLVLDVSSSMERHLWSARRAAWDLLRRVGEDTPVGLLACAGGPVPLAPFPTPSAEAARRLRGLPADPGDGTALLDCLRRAVGLLEAGAAGPGAAVVLLSDGRETFTGREDLGGAVDRLGERLARAAVRLEVLSYGRAPWLAELARASGGSRLAARGRNVELLGRRLGHHYELAYYADPGGAGWRRVEVQVEGEGLSVRAPAGYSLDERRGTH